MLLNAEPCNRSNPMRNKLSIIFVAVILAAGAGTASGATGVPKILNYQGRLFDQNGNLLGGTGTNYCFRFSIYDAPTPPSGTRLWPAVTSSVMTINVKSGVFSAGIGDTGAGGDALTFNFQDTDTAYLNVEVAQKVDALCTGSSEVFETLSPRQRIVASGYAINSFTVGGFTPAQSASSGQIPVLTGDALVLGGTSAQVNATGTNTLTLQGGVGTGAIQFFGASNFITSTGTLVLAGNASAASLFATNVSSTKITFTNATGSGNFQAGSINNTPIGSALASTGIFTNATTTGTFTVQGAALLQNALTVSAGVSALQGLTFTNATSSGNLQTNALTVSGIT